MPEQLLTRFTKFVAKMFLSYCNNVVLYLLPMLLSYIQFLKR